MKKFILLMLVFLFTFVLTLAGCSDKCSGEDDLEENSVSEQNLDNEEGDTEMLEMNSPIEKLVKTITYQGVDFEIVERPDVIWVGSMGFNENDYNADPSPLVANVHPLWGEFFENEILSGELLDNFIAPTAIGVLWLNMKNNDLPNGMMMAKEVYKAEYDPKYDVYTQPAGLYIRLSIDSVSAQLIGKEQCEPHELHGIMSAVAAENGYTVHSSVSNGIALWDIDYHDSDVGFIYAYLPVKHN